MDAEKRSSKGSFLQLFDWNVKSRKKLFSNNSELPEGPKQGNENISSSMTLHPDLLEAHENGPGPRSKRTSDYNSASSVTSDEGYGTRAPSVVARLMGLDSLPTSTISEPCSIPFCDSPFVRDACSQRNEFNFQIEHHVINSMANDGISWNLVESRPRKVQSRTIERFKTETLPPKSAKSIPFTHHRLLSPIKNPGFIQTNNVAYIMEAAAKIIEQGPPSTTKGKMPCFRSSSVPLRIRDLREKMEVTPSASRPPEPSRRPKEPISLKCNGGQDSVKNYSGSGNRQLYNASLASRKNSSDSMKNKGKSVSLALQTKVNVQRQEGSTSSGHRSSIKRKEGDEVKLGQFNKSQTSTQKTVQKRTYINKTSDVLKQNNQKQNSVPTKDKVALKASSSSQQDRKAPSSNGSIRPNKASNKVPNSATASKKMNSVAKDTGNELPSSKTKTSRENNQPIRRDFQFAESIAKNISIATNERSVKCSVTRDGCLNWDIVDRKSSMDVVSFTFTSPIKRSVPGSQTSGQDMEKNTRFRVDSCDDSDPHDLKNSTLSSQGLNKVGGDALSILLEQKLKELACRVESSNCNLVEDGSVSSAFNLQDSLSTLNITNTTMEPQNQLNLHKDKSGYLYDTNCASVEGLLLKAKLKSQGLEVMEGHSGSSYNSDYGTELDYRNHSSLSNLEPSSSDRSYDSSDNITSSIANGCQQSLLAETKGMADCVSERKWQPMEVETELTDSASSTSSASVVGKNSLTPFSLTDFKKSSKWELEYMTKILHNSQLNVDDFMLGQVNKVVSPYLFDQLEDSITGCDENAEENFKLCRKVLFDCVSECLELRGEQLFLGSCKALSKWETIFRRKGCLAEELYKEISSWTSIGDLMVDELVDKDMSSRNGRWVDFETEAFEEGVEIEEGILTCLVDELVADLLLI